MKNNIPTIMVVDDNPSNVSILLNLLQEYDTVPCVNGTTAIEIAQTDDIDLILLDIVMPDVDGFTVCKILKADKKTEHIPILFISAKNETDDITKGFKLGGVDYITKPFNPLELKCRVATHIKLATYQKDLEEKNLKLELLNEKIKKFAKEELESMRSNSTDLLGSDDIDFSYLIDNMTIDV